MSNDNMNEIYRTLQSSQDKYVYFELAAAMAAIGFTITQTNSLELKLSQIPLGIGVLCWSLSFLFGLLNRAYYNSFLYANFDYLKVLNGQYPNIPNNPDCIHEASKIIRGTAETKSNVINLLGRSQTWLLFLGAVFYMAWHIYEMYLRQTGG
jgi:hypothetical protein